MDPLDSGRYVPCNNNLCPVSASSCVQLDMSIRRLTEKAECESIHNLVNSSPGLNWKALQTAMWQDLTWCDRGAMPSSRKMRCLFLQVTFWGLSGISGATSQGQLGTRRRLSFGLLSFSPCSLTKCHLVPFARVLHNSFLDYLDFILF